MARYQPRGPICGFTPVVRECKAARALCPSSRTTAFREANVSHGHLTCRAWEANPVRVRPRTPFCPRSSVRSERHRAKVEVASATPAVDTTFIMPLCLRSDRTSFVNLYSSVRVRPEAPFYGDHDVTAASRPVKAFVPVRIRLVTPISMGRS